MFDTQHFYAEIRHVSDPNSANKVRLMIHGHHNSTDTPIKDEDLPWAHTLFNNSPQLNGLGKSVNYLPGTTVIGIWLDPETKQVPLVLGAIDKAALPEYE